MNDNPNRSSSREVEEAIQEYLDKIELRLKSSGTDSSESRAILNDLETQIRALLAEKGPLPTWNDLTAVLSKMDSPDKFAVGREPTRSKRSPVLVIAICLAVLAAVAIAFVATRSATPSEASAVIPEPVPPQVAATAPIAQPSPATPEPVIESASTPIAAPTPIVEPPPAPIVPPVAIPSTPTVEPPAVPAASEPVSQDIAVQEEIPVAIASFSSAANVRDADTVRRALSDGLINTLSQFNGIRVVERERIQEALQDLRMSSEGMIDQSTALRLGNMVGARVIVTGNILQMDDELVITARLINTETSELVATRANGPRGSLLTVVDKLAADVADRLMQDNKGVLARADDRSAERVDQQKQALLNQLKGVELPRLLVLLPETHLDRIVPDPAGETELVEWLLACHFPVASAEYEGVQLPETRSQWDSEANIQIHRPDAEGMREWLLSSRSVHSYVTGGLSKETEKLQEIADLMILGQGISERATARSGILSCKARLELKVIDIKTGDVLLAKSTYGAGLDVAEHIAGKRALQAAGRQMAIDLIPELAARWTETRSPAQAK